MKKLVSLLFVIPAFLVPRYAQAQARTGDSLQAATLQQCVQYALTHQPNIQQSLIDQQIVETTIKSKLADWYPQLNLAASLQHNFQ